MKFVYLIFTLLLISTLTARSQSADFTYNTTSGLFCSPQIVTFTASTTGNPTQYIWNFGDGQSGGSPVENHLYDYPGSYQVTLTEVFNNTASSISKIVVINPSPDVTLNVNRPSLCQPGNVAFTASATGTVASYEWNFGDGSPVQTTASNNNSHIYTAYGTFTTVVKAISDQGCSNTANVTVTIARFPISVSVAPNKGCLPANPTLVMTNTFPPGDGLQSVTWNYGDGSPLFTGTGSSTTHTYNTTSPITTANVSVTSNQGCTNSYTLPSFAYGIPPTNTVAYTTAARDTFCGSETVQFYGFADSANLYNWDFGDGNTQVTTTTTVSHKYDMLGAFSVVVTPSYNGCFGAPRTINIFIKGVIADFTYGNTCTNKATYNFTNNSLGTIGSYAWTFSDIPGFTESSTYSPSHTFPVNGTSNVKLVVVDNSSACSDSLSAIIYTATPLLQVDKNNVCRDSAITYTVINPYPAGSGFSYDFYINGNILPLGNNTSYTQNPRNYGTYNDFVVIRDQLASTCNDTVRVGAVNVRAPFVNFVIPAVQCIDTAVVLVNNSYPWFASDNIVKWKWDFADGQKDSVRNPIPHLYKVPGQHIVKLEATDINGCTQKYEAAVITAPLPPISVLPKIDTLCQGQSAVLYAYTSEQLDWVTTTNISCTTCDTVTVNPPATSLFIARATSYYGCKNYDTSLVKVYGPLNLSVSPNTTSICPGGTVQLALNTTGLTTWLPSTYLNSSTIKNPVSRPDASITYTAVVSDSVGCFKDSVSATVTVFPRPTVDAGPDQVLPYNTSFLLSPNYPMGVVSYNWTPGTNLNCTNCATPTGIALDKQLYTIEVTDQNGCKGKDSLNIVVSCEKSNLLLPTAFTPNGDGRNESFYPIARGYKSIKSFTVFNRSGAKVFERQNFQPNIPGLGWNGMTIGGQLENMQSYVWVVEGICQNGMSIITRGTVILIK